jgi:hypothetical protein
MTTRIEILDNGPLKPGQFLRLLIAALLTAFVVGALAGCVTGSGGEPIDKATHIIRLGDGRLFGVQIPPEIIAQGRGVAETYLAAKYPVAQPYVSALADRLFPAYAAPREETVTVPVKVTLGVDVKLKDDTIIPASKIKTIFVSRNKGYELPPLPEPEQKAYTPGEFAEAFMGASAPTDAVASAVVDPVSQPVPAHTNLESALEAIGGAE